MTEERIALLEKFGFKHYVSTCDLSLAFRKPAYVLDTNIFVSGAHGTETAQIFYCEEENFKGLCYLSSLMESLMVDFSGNHGVPDLVSKMANVIHAPIEFGFLRIFPMVGYSDFCENIDEDDLEYGISTMLKAIGILDYLLQEREMQLMGKQID